MVKGVSRQVVVVPCPDAYIQSNLEKRKRHSERWVLIGGALLAVGAAIAVILL